MDEIAIAAIVTSGVLSGTVSWLIAKATSPEPIPPMYISGGWNSPFENTTVTVDESLSVTVDSATLHHEHSPTTVGSRGWACACGLHWHRFQKGVCACGETGEVDQWRTT